jgi:hypothetical protein
MMTVSPFFSFSASTSGQEGVELVREMGAHVVVDGKRTVDIDDRACRFAPGGVDAYWHLPAATALRNASMRFGRAAVWRIRTA